MIPFAVVGSEKTIVVAGKQVRGRQNRWGVVNGKRILVGHFEQLLTSSQLRTRTTANSYTSATSLPVPIYKTSLKPRRKSTMRASARSSFLHSRRAALLAVVTQAADLSAQAQIASSAGTRSA